MAPFVGKRGASSIQAVRTATMREYELVCAKTKAATEAIALEMKRLTTKQAAINEKLAESKRT